MRKNKLSKIIQYLYIKEEIKSQTCFISNYFSNESILLDANGFVSSNQCENILLDKNNNIDFESLHRNKKSSNKKFN